MTRSYIHGYTKEETLRLYAQSAILKELFFRDIKYPPASRVLEVGCGVGAQTRHLLSKCPEVQLTSIDLSLGSLQQTRSVIRKLGGDEVSLVQADLHSLPFASESFDHLFICFVLEHLEDPVEALLTLKDVLKPGGSITAIEGDHGSCLFHPESNEAWHVWNCLIEVQKRLGGDSLVGRKLYPLMNDSGFHNVVVDPLIIYTDSGNPAWVEFFAKKTILAMVSGIRERALEFRLSDEKQWETGVKALSRTAHGKSGVFCYTFFKAVATK